MNHTDKLVTALDIAGPFCLKVRFEDYPKCCIQAASAGAEALRRFGLKARAVKCMLLVSDGETNWWIGSTKQESYDLMLEVGSGEVPPFDEFFRQCPRWHGDEDPIHVAIEVDERWLLDLTAGQAAFPSMPPSVCVEIKNGWPVYADGRGLQILWAKTSRGEEPPKYTNEGLVLDMMDGIRMAMGVGLDPVRFVDGISIIDGHIVQFVGPR